MILLLWLIFMCNTSPQTYCTVLISDYNGIRTINHLVMTLVSAVSRNVEFYSCILKGLFQTSVMELFGKNPAGNYMFKVNNRNTRTRCEICSKLTIKTLECHSGIFIVNFENISPLVLVFLLLPLNM